MPLGSPFHLLITINTVWVILFVRNRPDVPRTMLVDKKSFRNVLGGEFGRPGGMQSLLGEAGDQT